MNVLTETDVCADGETPKLLPEEELMQSFQKIQLDFGHSDQSIGVGTLYVTSVRAIWLAENPKLNTGYAWDFTTILLHAVSTDTEAFPYPCLYCQLTSEEPNEIRFSVKEGNSDLTAMFQAFSQAALLNPDQEDETEGEAADWIYNDQEIEAGSEQAEMLARFDEMLQVAEDPVDGQFDDADEL